MAYLYGISAVALSTCSPQHLQKDVGVFRLQSRHDLRLFCKDRVVRLGGGGCGALLDSPNPTVEDDDAPCSVELGMHPQGSY